VRSLFAADRYSPVHDAQNIINLGKCLSGSGLNGMVLARRAQLGRNRQFTGTRARVRSCRRCKSGERFVTLLKWALLFFVVSVVAGILGFTGVSAASADIARVLFYVFVVIFVVLLLLGLTIFRA
jgi:uncharacterized membrane protein YtjA (UPF0391 family)